MTALHIVLLGWGRVAQEFWQVLHEQAPAVRQRHGVALSIAGIRRSTLAVRPRPGQVPGASDWSPAPDLPTFLAETQARLVVQAIPSGQEDAAAAFEQVVSAFVAGADVVTATKSHLVRRWSELEQAARSTGRAIRVSASTGAALPAADLARRSFRGFPCRGVRGSLNGTSNFVLNEMAAGGTLEEAVATAQREGIAERDPSADLGGYDAASKLVILANLLWGRATTIDDVETEPIDARTAEASRAAAGRGRALRAIATATEDAPAAMRVRLEEVPERDALYRLPRSEKAVEFDCGVAGTVVVSGGKSSPRGAALAMLKDALNLATGDREPGFG